MSLWLETLASFANCRQANQRSVHFALQLQGRYCFLIEEKKGRRAALQYEMEDVSVSTMQEPSLTNCQGDFKKPATASPGSSGGLQSALPNCTTMQNVR